MRDTRIILIVSTISGPIANTRTLPLQVLFLEASEQVIVNRYKETRHRHPLDPRGSDLSGAIRREIAALAPLRELADHVVDTSGLN
ncbi:MAG: hypothetical protein II630_07405, partial [Bacteroidales bacterium]|nr:hypothetical protein [Bacteroidales bacterium]